MLDTGSELHLAVVPEIVEPVAESWSFSARFFNGFVLAYPTQEVAQQRDAVREQCRQSASAAARCVTSRRDTGLGIELDVGAIQHFQGVNVRYQIGFQSAIDTVTAVGQLYSGANYDDSPDTRYTRYSVSSTRGVATIGVEW
jgi:hypothetical protein